MNKRLTLLLLFLLFFGPLVAAWVWFFYFSDARPGNTVNNGDLIQPVVALTDAELYMAGATSPVQPFDEDWTLLFLAPDGCDTDCQQALVITRQVWIRLNKDADRVQRIMVTGFNTEAGIDAEAHRDIQVFQADSPFFRNFSDPQRSALKGEKRVYLVDPLGNLMMSYPLTLEAKMLHDDLKRLLRYSEAG